MAVDLAGYGNPGKFLIARGWRVLGESKSRGTAACDGPNKTIWMNPLAFRSPNARVRKYVLPHEIWHAVHYEMNKYNVDSLVVARGMTRSGAIEAIADGSCLLMNKSRAMKLWVRASVAWHGKVGYKYSWADVCSPEVAAVYSSMIELINEQNV